MIKNLRVKKKIKNYKDKNAENGGKSQGGIKAIIFSMIISIVLFFILIGIETSILDNYEKTEVVVAKIAIVDGTEITNENVDTYFEVKNVDASLKTSSTVTSVESLSGYIIRETIDQNEIISRNGLIKKGNVIEKLKSPVEVSFKAVDIAQVVGGILRPGDLIDISVVGSDSREAEKVLDEVYVSKVFNSVGIEIAKVEKDVAALVINVLIDKETEDVFNEKILSGTVRISKVNGIN